MKTCNNCEKELSSITMSSADWERNEQRHERREKRHVWIHIILIFLLVLTNALWIWYESQFVETEEDILINADGSGNANYIGQDGDIYNGVDKN